MEPENNETTQPVTIVKAEEVIAMIKTLQGALDVQMMGIKNIQQWLSENLNSIKEIQNNG
jgi:hypothetical protein